MLKLVQPGAMRACSTRIYAVVLLVLLRQDDAAVLLEMPGLLCCDTALRVLPQRMCCGTLRCGSAALLDAPGCGEAPCAAANSCKRVRACATQRFVEQRGSVMRRPP